MAHNSVLRFPAPTAVPEQQGPCVFGARVDPNLGALVVSLDFELHWGVRDLPLELHRARILGAREAVVRMLDLFDEYGISATWATVGMLFAETRTEMEEFLPAVRPGYRDRRLDPYGERIGASESEDPLHFAPSLIRRIQAQGRQEIGSHTFSHYYCLEPGQTVLQFKADLNSAVGIAARRGIRIQSLVLPRNQMTAEHLAVLPEFGVRCYRGVESHWLYRSRKRSDRQAALKRMGRLADAYVNLTGHNLVEWPELQARASAAPPVNVPSSRYLRSYSSLLAPARTLELERIRSGMRAAARHRKAFHLWWHPEDFGTHLNENIAGLRTVLDEYRSLRDAEGMQSLPMVGFATAGDLPISRAATAAPML
jgi:hypothetical protein